MVGRPDGEEVMVAASAGEVQGEGEILSNYCGWRSIGFPGS